MTVEQEDIYDFFVGNVYEMSDEVLRKNSTCPIAYNDADDIRRWHSQNGMTLIMCKRLKEPKVTNERKNRRFL